MESRFQDYELIFVLKNWESHFEIYFRNRRFHIFDVASESWVVSPFDSLAQAIDYGLRIMGVSPIA